MANLEEIDIDNYLVIEVPAGKKKQLSEAIAYDNGYITTIKNTKTITKTGTALELATLVDGFTEYQKLIEKILITDEANINFGKSTISYLDNTPIENPISAEQFGVIYVQKEIGLMVRKAVKNAQLKALKQQLNIQLENAEKQIEEGLDAQFENLKIK